MANPAATSVARPLLRSIASRLAFLWLLKAFGTMSFMAVFFWGYFTVLHNPLTPPRVMPATALDDWIAFTPWALPAYVSLWVYVSLAPALLGSLRALLSFGGWIALLCGFCLALFLAFPTSTPPYAIDLALHPEFATIRGLDASSNAFPSLHVATAVFAAFWLDRVLRELDAPHALRWLNAVQCSAIIWSTIATRQHVVLDAVGGLAVGIVFAALSLRKTRTPG